MRVNKKGEEQELTATSKTKRKRLLMFLFHFQLPVPSVVATPKISIGTSIGDEIRGSESSVLFIKMKWRDIWVL